MRRVLMFSVAMLAPSLAFANVPYETDDPEPTEPGHYEIYTFGAGEGLGASFDRTGGLDMSYGAARNLQISATIPFKWVHDQGTQTGIGDVEVGAKIRFFHSDKASVSLATFPRLILPTSGKKFGTGRVQFLLPVWGQKEFGKWLVFGGGGYTLNPGPGNRNFWRAGLAVTHEVSDRLKLGAEVTRQGADSTGGSGSTALGLGATVQLKVPFSLLFSAGPRFDDNGGPASYHVYTGLGISF